MPEDYTFNCHKSDFLFAIHIISKIYHSSFLHWSNKFSGFKTQAPKNILNTLNSYTENVQEWTCNALFTSSNMCLRLFNSHNLCCTVCFGVCHRLVDFFNKLKGNFHQQFCYSSAIALCLTCRKPIFVDFCPLLVILLLIKKALLNQ